MLASTRSKDRENDRQAVDRLRRAQVEARFFPLIARQRRLALWGMSPLLILWMIWNVRRFEIIHLHYVWSMTTLIGCLVGRVHRMPIVITPHESLTDFDIETASGKKSKEILKRLVRRFVLSSADGLILASQLEVDRTKAGNLRVALVPHPVPLPDTKPPTDEGSSEGFHIGFLGRHAEKKGLARLIEAFAMSGRDDWYLSLGGPPSPDHGDEPYQQLARELGVGQRIDWPGQIVEEKDSFLSSLDVLVMPSDFESFGMVAAEAMACGTPVIVPKASGIAPLVMNTNSGIVVERPQPLELLAALKTLYSDPDLRAEMGLQGRQAISINHSFARFQQATADLYSDLLDSR